MHADALDSPNAGAIWLAWASTAKLNGTPVVTAIKSHELGSSKRGAEKGSVFVEPSVYGNRQAPNWYLLEGETDCARGLELVSGKAAVMLLPAGALTFKPRWADVIPHGATVFLCHDADEPGDTAPTRRCGSSTTPSGCGQTVDRGDWCDWPGEREQFAELVAAAVREAVTFEVMSARELCALPDPPRMEQLLGPLLLRGQRLVLGAHTGEGKISLVLQIVRALTSGGEFLDWQGSGGRAVMLDAERACAPSSAGDRRSRRDRRSRAGKLTRVLVDGLFELALALDVSTPLLVDPARGARRAVRPILNLGDYRDDEQARSGQRFYLLESQPFSEWNLIEECGKEVRRVRGAAAALQFGDVDG